MAYEEYEELDIKESLCREAAKRTAGTMQQIWLNKADILSSKKSESAFLERLLGSN